MTSKEGNQEFRRRLSPTPEKDQPQPRPISPRAIAGEPWRYEGLRRKLFIAEKPQYDAASNGKFLNGLREPGKESPAKNDPLKLDLQKKNPANESYNKNQKSISINMTPPRPQTDDKLTAPNDKNANLLQVNIFWKMMFYVEVFIAIMIIGVVLNIFLPWIVIYFMVLSAMSMLGMATATFWNQFSDSKLAVPNVIRGEH
ncbi:hypothetical protein BZA77DRAFT_321014 [Pyronema omphalodes]|nr:hypothetical protein BZA77DRAFT_321014 [Pyronema omphalodes]